MLCKARLSPKRHDLSQFGRDVSPCESIGPCCLLEKVYGNCYTRTRPQDLHVTFPKGRVFMETC